MAEVKVGGKGGQGLREFVQTNRATSHCVRHAEAFRRAGLLRAVEDAEQQEEKDLKVFRGHDSGSRIL